jgi:ABC-type multidrug transport system fused ATPase/permease subunit
MNKQANISNITSLIQSIIKKNNSKNIIFLIGFIFLASLFEVIALLCIAPILKLATGNMESADRASAILEKIFPFVSMDNSLNVFLLFFLLAIITSLLLITSNLFAQKIKYQYCAEVLKESVTDIFNSSSIFFSRSQEGKLINSFTKELNNMGDSLAALSRAASYIIQIFFYLSAIFFLSSATAILIFIILVAVYSPLFFIGTMSRRLGKKNTVSNNNFLTSLQENFYFFKNIISYGIQKKIVFQIVSKFDSAAKAAIQSYLADFTISTLFIPLTILGISIIFYFKSYLGISLSEISIIIITFYRMSSRINLVAKEKNTLDKSIFGFNQIYEIKELAKSFSFKFRGIYDFNFKDKFIIKNLYQKFGNSEILNNINLEFEAKEIIAFIGKSGSGKTSLADIISGINQPSAGVIQVDDKNFYDFNYDSLRSKISYVSQENMLLNLSIKENIRLYDQAVSDESIMRACKLANCEEFINKLPDKYETNVGERGSKLSAGQIQRLSLARAIARKPEILILDEVTSALDNISEKLIYETLMYLKKECTVLIIAHRLSFLKKVDKIFIFENGQLVDQGNYDYMNKKSNAFQNLVNK